MSRKLLTIIIIVSTLSCSSKIKSIIEYRKSEKKLIKNRLAEFDKNGNKVFERGFGNQRSNRITKTQYENGQKIFEIDCDFFEKQDTCVIRQFSKFEYSEDSKTIKQTMFESDSAIRFIRTLKIFKNMKVENVNTWEMFPSKNPELEKAMKLTDTIYYDRSGREIKRLNYNEDFEKPYVEIYHYLKHGYSKEVKGTKGDTVRFYKYNKLQKKADRKNVDFNFRDTINYEYIIKYY